MGRIRALSQNNDNRLLEDSGEPLVAQIWQRENGQVRVSFSRMRQVDKVQNTCAHGWSPACRKEDAGRSMHVLQMFVGWHNARVSLGLAWMDKQSFARMRSCIQHVGWATGHNLGRPHVGESSATKGWEQNLGGSVGTVHHGHAS